AGGSSGSSGASRAETAVPLDRVLWGRMASCGRVALGPAGLYGRVGRRVTNPPQVASLPHKTALAVGAICQPLLVSTARDVSEDGGCHRAPPGSSAPSARALKR